MIIMSVATRRSERIKWRRCATKPPPPPIVEELTEEEEEHEPPPPPPPYEETSDLWTIGWRFYDGAWCYIFDDGAPPMPPGLLTPFTKNARLHLQLWRRLCRDGGDAEQRMRDIVLNINGSI